MKWLKGLLIISLLAALALSMLAYLAWQWLHESPLHEGGQEQLELTVQSGQSLGRLAADLSEEQWLRYPKIWLAYARYKGLATQIQAGQYQLNFDITPVQLLGKLVDGDVQLSQLRVIEGSRYADMQDIVQAHSAIEQTVADWSDDSLKQALGLPPEMALEGWFYPDTMLFAEGTTDISLLKAGYARMQDVLASEWQKKAENLPYETAYEALIMASIVEKETGRASERAEIAGVFVRRLNKRMRLQTDPTVIYGLGPDFDGNIRYRHLREDTPYNTYTRAGLPPSPIALPGRAAIHAALHPADGETLFFVAKGDGSHYFSKTLAEHEKAVREYQLKRRADYRSSP
ncbi:MAG: endolytic transglycosylase MltG [Pseudomonadales bacterium]